MLKIIIGLIGIAAGAIVIIKTEWFLKNFGRINWAEQHIHTEGGSRLMYKLIGLIIILLSAFLMTGILENIGLSIVGLMTPG